MARRGQDRQGRSPPCSPPPCRRRTDSFHRALRPADPSPMATVTFLVHPDRPDALELATATAGWLTERGDVARILQFSGPARAPEAGADIDLHDVDFGGTTVAVSMGGDGTFL